MQGLVEPPFVVSLLLVQCAKRSGRKHQQPRARAMETEVAPLPSAPWMPPPPRPVTMTSTIVAAAVDVADGEGEVGEEVGEHNALLVRRRAVARRVDEDDGPSRA